MTAVRLLVSVGVVGVLLFGFAIVTAFVVRAPGNAALVLVVCGAALVALRDRSREPFLRSPSHDSLATRGHRRRFSTR